MTRLPDDEDNRDDGAPEPAVPAAEPRAPPAPPAAFGRQLIWPAAVLVLIVVITAAPFWAPAVIPLLPWGQRAAPPAADTAALTARLDTIDQQAAAAREAIRSSQTALAQRLDRLAAGTGSDGDLKSAVVATQTAVAHLGQRLDAADAQSTRAADEIRELRQSLARLDQRTADLGDRVGAVERRTQAEIGAGRTEAALLLALLQLRAAVDAGGPFAAEYDALGGLARDRPEIAAAARPLAASAGAGVPSRAALRRELREIADRLATTAEPAPAPQGEWWEETLARLRGLVTVRRIGGPPGGAAAALARAQGALDAGDLSGAVSALGVLSGHDAEAVRAWVQGARARLGAEAALGRVQALLTARLGAPEGVPNPPSAKPGAPP
jgi:hypothetical protein